MKRNEDIDIEATSLSIDQSSPQLKKSFTLWSTCGLQYSIICSSLAIGTFLSTVIGVGGAPVLIYGFILGVSFNLMICFSLAEIASAFPNSSAQVHWTYVLAPAHLKRILSFFAGVLSCAGWIFACFSSTLVAANFVLSLAEMYHPDYVPETWHTYLIYSAILITGYAINAFQFKLMPSITHFLVFVINFGTLFIIITLLVKSNPKRSADFVFVHITNETGWPSKGLVFFLGLLPSLASVTLFDGAVHVTDEIEEPEKNIPKVMVISNTASAVMAFFAAVVYMFCIVNVDNLNNPIGGMPIVQLMLDSFNSNALTTVGVLCLIITFVGSSYMYYCSTSRLIWAFAKSNGLPFGERIFGKVSPTFNTPVYALTFVLVICLILGTMIFGSASALNAVLGTSMVCIDLSYFFPIACLLYQSRFSMSPYKRYPMGEKDELVVDPKTGLPYFHLGKLGTVLNVCSCLWVCFVMVWLNFPLTYPVTTENMNYACAVLGCTLIIGAILWFAHARKNYVHLTNLAHI